MNLLKNPRLVVIALFGLALNISISGAQILAALLLLEWFWRLYKNRRSDHWEKSGLDVAIIIFILWGFLSGLVHRPINFSPAVSSLSAFLLFFWAAHAIDRDELAHLFKWIIVGAILSGLMGVIQFLAQVNSVAGQGIIQTPTWMRNWPEWLLKPISLNSGRAMGFRSHPLTYAECFFPGFFLFLTFMSQKIKSFRGDWKNLFAPFMGLVLMLGGILFAQGRAVWLGLAGGILVFGWMSGRRFFLKSVFLLTALLVILVASSPQIRGRFLSVFSPTSGSHGDQLSKSIRFSLWHQSLEGIKSRPWLGQGLDGVHLVTVNPYTKAEVKWTETHNMFLQISAELGLIGLGLFFWILVILIKMISGLRGHWRVALGGILTAFLIAGLTESWPNDKEVAMMFWLMMGSLASLKKHESHP